MALAPAPGENVGGAWIHCARTSTPVNVCQVIHSPRFFNATSGTLQRVLDYMAFDVAFLFLESDLAAPEVAGILTADQVKSLVDSAVPVTALGYGCTVSRGGMSTVPKAVAMPLRGVPARWWVGPRVPTSIDGVDLSGRQRDGLAGRQSWTRRQRPSHTPRPGDGRSPGSGYPGCAPSRVCIEGPACCVPGRGSAQAQ